MWFCRLQHKQWKFIAFSKQLASDFNLYSIATSGNCDFKVAIKGQHSPLLLVTAKCCPSKLGAQLVYASLPHKGRLQSMPKRRDIISKNLMCNFLRQAKPNLWTSHCRKKVSVLRVFKRHGWVDQQLDVKSKWVKIDLIMVPYAFFILLLSMGLTKPFSAREARHPPPLKMELSTAQFYVYNISVLTNVFAAILPLKTKAYFRCNQEVRVPQSGRNLTAQEKIALARQRAGTRWGIYKWWFDSQWETYIKATA